MSTPHKSAVFSQPETTDIDAAADVLILSAEDSPDMIVGTIAFTAFLNVVSGNQGLYSRDAMSFTGDGNHLSIYVQNGELFARVQSDGKDLRLSYDNFQALEDTHVAFSFDGETVALFIDGEKVDEGTSTYTQASSPEPTQFGALGWFSESGSSSFSNVMDGSLSDIHLFNQTLTGSQIADLSDGLSIMDEPDEEQDIPTASQPETPDQPLPEGSELLYSLNSVDINSGMAVVELAGDAIASTTEATIAFTITPDAVEGRQGLFSRDATGTDDHISVYLQGSRLVARLQDGDGQDLRMVYEGIQAGEETHISVTFDGTRATLNVNGQTVDSGQTNLTWETSEEAIQIGALGWGSSVGETGFVRPFTGEIADVAIYGTAFDAETLASLADASLNGSMFEPEPAEEQDPQPEPAVDPDPEPQPTSEPDPEPQPTAAGLTPAFALSGTQIISDTSDVVNLPGEEFLQLEETTIAFSFKANDVTPLQGLVSRDASFMSGDGNHLSVFIRDGVLAARLQDGSSEIRLAYGERLTSDTEYHVALSFGAGTASLLINGEIVDTGTSDITWVDSPEYVQVGGLGWASQTGTGTYKNPLDGEISNFAVYGEILNETQVQALVGEEISPPSTVEQDPVVEPQTPDVAEQDPEPAPQPDPTPAPEPDPTPLPEPGQEPEPTQVAAPNPNVNGEIEHGTVLNISQVSAVDAGRVTTLQHGGDNIDTIRVVDGPQFGNLTVNPDNTLALVMSDSTRTGQISFSYEVTYDNGSTRTFSETMNVTQGSQAEAWGEGEYYMLEEDENGNVVVEHGDEHREVYTSGSNSALSRADIAQMEGLNTSQITGAWLANNPEYGGSAEMALETGLALDLWETITAGGQTSNWLLFERGYEYDGDIMPQGTSGESEFNPLYFGAYGSGTRPVITDDLRLFAGNGPFENIVFQGLEFANGVQMLTGENILFDDVDFALTANIQNTESVTVRNSTFLDIHREESKNGGDWESHGDRIQGMFIKNSDGILLEDLLFDLNGWEPGYDPGLDGDSPQAPSIFSQNLYVANDNTDVTLRDTISMRASSYGAQMRGGGLIEDNLFLDNNAGVATLGGDYRGAGHIGNYTLFNGNIVTSGAHRDQDGTPGALTLGIDNDGEDSTLIDNIVTHLADPDNYQEFLEKYWTHSAIESEHSPYYNDTIVYNWAGSRTLDFTVTTNYHDANIEGLDTDLLNQTTIQNYAADLLNDPNATIADLAEYLRGVADGSIDDDLEADDILEYFRASFGVESQERTETGTLQFTPDDRADGFRWDNRLNWSEEQTPIDGDNIELAGNWVTFGGTVAVNDLDIGAGGALSVGQGKLTVGGELSGGAGAAINIDGAGQLWVEAYHDTASLDLNVDGGRFANTGEFDGRFDMDVTDGEALLGVDTAEFQIGNGSTLTLRGDDADVGFDGEYNGISMLRMEQGGRLEMIADTDGFATIEEFASGAFDDEADVLSAVDMGEGTLMLDVTALGAAASEHVLIDADEIAGVFDNIQINGLAGNRDATLNFDYENDQLVLSLSARGEGSGEVTMMTTGQMDDTDSTALWNALTEGQPTYEDMDLGTEVNGEQYDEEDYVAA